MRRVVLALLAIGLLLAQSPPLPGQTLEEPSVDLRLVRQTPWVSLKEPELAVTIRATNTGNEAVDQLELGVTLWSPVRTRIDYEASLVSDPTLPVHSEVLPREGPLRPGTSRVFELSLDVTSFPGVDEDQSLVYPLRIDLRSGGELVAGAELRTPVVVLVRTPETPLNLAWTVVLHQPIQFGPSGVFRSAALEAAIAPGGRFAGAVSALRTLEARPEPTPVDVVVSPTLLMQLDRMLDGYEVQEGSDVRVVRKGRGGAADAASMLGDLRAIASQDAVELSTFPYSAPLLPSLLSSGVARDLQAQLELGRSEVNAQLGISPTPGVMRPPASSLDREALTQLREHGVGLLLLDPTSVPPRVQPQGFAPPPTASLESGAGPITAVVPDPGLQALVASPSVVADPALAAQAVLGELAMIWGESPSVSRGVALVLPEQLSLPAAFTLALAQGIGGAPWLHPVTASQLAAQFPPPENPGQLVPTPAGVFSRTYVESLKRARRLIGVYASILAEPDARADRLEQLRRKLLLAEAGEFVAAWPLGDAFIQSVRNEILGQFAKVDVDTTRPVTLASTNGTVPLSVTNGTAQPLRVIVQLVAPGLELTSPPEVRELSVGDHILTMGVRLQRTGRFRATVLITAPSGRTIREKTLIVRSTALNRIALYVTIGAAIVLLALWARRFLPRARS